MKYLYAVPDISVSVESSYNRAYAEKEAGK